MGNFDQLEVEYIRGSDWGGGVGGLLYSLRSGTASYNHYNSRGDVTGQTDASGALTYQAAYESFGRHGDTASSQEWGSSADRQRANTKDEDPTGLLNEGFRYRDLDVGAFITRDPLGFVDGPNLYTYVVQNPWTYYDPLGLKRVKDYEGEIKHHTEQQSQARGRIAELQQEGSWKDRTPEQNREMLKLHGELRRHGNAIRRAEEGRNSIFESAYNISEKLGIAIDPMSIDDEDAHYQSVNKAMSIIDWIPGASTAYAINRGETSEAAKAFATEVAITYLGGKLLQKAFGTGAVGVDEMVTVSRWGRSGLKDGDFVMQGNANWWNYARSGKWQIGMGNQYAPFKTGQEFVVSKSSLLPPSAAATAHPIADKGIAGWYKKVVLGQRSYKSN